MLKFVCIFYSSPIISCVPVSFVALSVQSSGGDSWTKQVSYTGSEPNSEVACMKLYVFCC